MTVLNGLYAAQVYGSLENDDPPTLEAVVPISTSFRDLTMRRLYGLFEEAGEADCKHVMIALVSSDGTVTLQRVFNHVQPPEEGKPKVAEDDDGVVEQLQEQVPTDE